MRIDHKLSETSPEKGDDSSLSDLLSRPPRKWRTRHVVAAALFVAHTLGFVSSLDALMSGRTAQGTVAWIVSLNTFPYVAVPTYWIFGRTKFQGYVVARREDDNELYRELSNDLATVRGFHADDARGEGHIAAIEPLGRMPVLEGNSVEMLIDGEQTFDSIFRGIEAAERYVLVQFYIIRDDRLGGELSRLLQAKAREGLQVYFLYDELGSYKLSATYFEELTQAGVQVRPFNSTRGWRNRLQYNFRNHRKVVVTDGRVGWLGGLNAGDEYLGENEEIGPWRDTHLRIEGPAAAAVQVSFVEDWHWASGDILNLDWEPSPVKDDVPVLVMPTGPADRFDTASLMVQHAIHSAQHRLWISSPYFVPDEGVLSALKIAAFRGVDVRVLIPERSDNVLTYYAAYAFIRPLLETGVTIHRYQEGLLHAKTFLIDDDAAAIGTVNLDNRSFRLNFEITAWVLDRDFAAQMEAAFEKDFARSRTMSPDEVEQQPWWFKVVSRAAYLTAPIL